MSGVNNFAVNINHKIIISSNINGPFPKKSVAPSEKVAPSVEVEKVSGTLDDI